MERDFAKTFVRLSVEIELTIDCNKISGGLKFWSKFSYDNDKTAKPLIIPTRTASFY
jgi:hypothetical protein